MSENEQNPLVPASEPEALASAGDLQRIMDAAGQGPLTTWSSLAPKTDEERAAYYAALDGETVGFAEVVNQEIAIKNIAFQVRDAMDATTGEMYRALRSILFLSDGRVVSGQSTYVARSLRNLLQSGFVPPFVDPLRVRLIQITLDQGKRMYRLQLMGGGGRVPPKKTK